MLACLIFSPSGPLALLPSSVSGVRCTPCGSSVMYVSIDGEQAWHLPGAERAGGVPAEHRVSIHREHPAQAREAKYACAGVFQTHIAVGSKSECASAVFPRILAGFFLAVNTVTLARLFPCGGRRHREGVDLQCLDSVEEFAAVEVFNKVDNVTALVGSHDNSKSALRY